jgi:hypothetical protein
MQPGVRGLHGTRRGRGFFGALDERSAGTATGFQAFQHDDYV